jgi:hypothetical protein
VAEKAAVDAKVDTSRPLAQATISGIKGKAYSGRLQGDKAIVAGTRADIVV